MPTILKRDHATHLNAQQSLVGLVDYAIAEGEELGLPAFVFLLRTAREELLMSGKAPSSRQPRGQH